MKIGLCQTILSVYPEFRTQYQLITRNISGEVETVAELLVIETLKIIHALFVWEELRTAGRYQRRKKNKL